jgi:hypothetical protein
MLIDVIKIVPALVMVLAGLATFASVMAAFIGFMLTIRRRKPSVRFLKAMAWRNVIFHAELYEDDANRWRRLHIMGFVATWVSVLVAVVASLCLQGLGLLQR